MAEDIWFLDSEAKPEETTAIQAVVNVVADEHKRLEDLKSRRGGVGWGWLGGGVVGGRGWGGGVVGGRGWGGGVVGGGGGVGRKGGWLGRLHQMWRARAWRVRDEISLNERDQFSE